MLPYLPPADPRAVDPRSVVEPSVGGGAWVRAVHDILPDRLVDRVDVDGDAPGLELDLRPGEGALAADWLEPFTKIEHPPTRDGRRVLGGWHPLSRWSWQLCVGNRPYRGELGPWVERCLERAQVVALLERATITGTETRLPWWLAHRPQWIANVVPRPKWEGPGARTTADGSETLLIVWVRGGSPTTLWDWIDVLETGHPAQGSRL